MYDDPKTNCSLVNWAGNGCAGENLGATVAVGSHPAGASPYGLHDMEGNAVELTEDKWKNDLSSVPPDGSPWTSDHDIGGNVRKGGCSKGIGTCDIRSASRNYLEYNDYHNLTGFRCCKDMEN